MAMAKTALLDFHAERCLRSANKLSTRPTLPAHAIAERAFAQESDRAPSPRDCECLLIMNRTPSIRPRAPSFPNDGPALITPTGEAAISVTRFAPTELSDGLNLAMPREDAFVLLFQLAHHPAHDLWLDGRFHRAEAASRSTLFIV